jgi:hypothetical protein
MSRRSRWLAPVLAAMGLAFAAPAEAQRKKPDPAHTVIDDAGLFSEAARQKANNEIVAIKRRFHKDLLIETVARIERGGEAVQFQDRAEKRKFFQQLANQKSNSHRIEGIYVLISRKPPYVQAVAGEATQKEGLFTKQNADALAEIFVKELGKDHDKALLDAVAFVRRTFNTNSGAGAAVPGLPGRRPPVGDGEVPQPAIPPWVGYVCVGFVVLLVLWVIVGVIRGIAGGPRPGYGGAGYGGPGGYYGGGGGGGFFSSMLGGMFGAAAGMWMYNHFFGGGTPVAGAGAPPMAGGGGDTGPSDVGGDYTGGGGDWSDDAAQDGGGGDQGDGGGDWSGGDTGGGDTGGGDWGGGDVGGGGGDVGGGGGDWGGGGGDFGGGGGGGDW